MTKAFRMVVDILVEKMKTGKGKNKEDDFFLQVLQNFGQKLFKIASSGAG